MRKSKIIKWNEQEVVVKELTIEQISSVLESDPEPTTIDLIFYDRIPAAAVMLSTGLTRESLQEEISPSEFDSLWSAVEEVNPFFCQSPGSSGGDRRGAREITLEQGCAYLTMRGYQQPWQWGWSYFLAVWDELAKAE